VKKRNFIIASIICALFSISLLVISVYALLNSQSFLINNQIIFKGNDHIKFLLDAKITGTTYGDGEFAPKYRWDYDYNKTDIHSDSWTVPDLYFDSANKSLEEIQIVYAFSVVNYSDCDIIVEINGPGVLGNGITQKITTGLDKENLQEGTEVIIEQKQTGEDYNTGYIYLILGVSDRDGYEGYENVNFEIIVNKYEI